MKKRILFVSHDAYILGASRSLVDLVAGLQQTGHYDCKIILPSNGPLEDLLNEQNLTYQVIPYTWSVTSNQFSTPGPVTARQRLTQNLKTYRAFKLLNRTFKPDLVLFNTSTSYFPQLFFNYWKVKTLIHIREYGLENLGLIHDWSGFFFKRVLKKVNKVLTNSKAVMLHYAHQYQTAPLTVLYNGICTSAEFERRKAIQKSESSVFRIGVIGVITANKGQQLVLEAFNKIHHTNCQLYYFGEGELESALRNRTNELQLNDKVFFMGFEKNADKIYSQLDLVVVSSSYEAFGRVAVEAMSYGIPVLGYNNGGTAEIIKDGCGLLFDGSVEDLSKQLTRIVSDADLRKEISEKAWTYAAKNFSREVYVSNFIAITDQLLQRTSSNN